MPLPGNVTTVTVTGSYTSIDGQPVEGNVSFAPRASRFVDIAALRILLGNRIVAPLVNGSFSVDLPATDDPDIVPAGFTYHVKETLIRGGSLSYDISVPSARAGAGGGINLATVTKIPPVFAPPDSSIASMEQLAALTGRVVTLETAEASGEYESALDHGLVLGEPQTTTVDQTTAILATLTAAAANKKPAWFPAGFFGFMGDIQVPSGVVVLGAGRGAKITNGGTWTGGTYFLALAANARFIFGKTTGAASNNDGVTVASGEFVIDANGVATQPLWIAKWYQGHLSQVAVRNSPGSGFWFEGCQNSLFTGLTSMGNKTDFTLKGFTAGNVFEKCEAAKAGGSGAGYGGGWHVEFLPSDDGSASPLNNVFEQTIFEFAHASTLGSVHHAAGTNNLFDNCYFGTVDATAVGNVPAAVRAETNYNGLGAASDFLEFRDCRFATAPAGTLFDLDDAAGVDFSGYNQLLQTFTWAFRLRGAGTRIRLHNLTPFSREMNIANWLDPASVGTWNTCVSAGVATLLFGPPREPTTAPTGPIRRAYLYAQAADDNPAWWKNNAAGPTLLSPGGRQTVGTASPTTGTWAVGDTCWTSNPTAGGPAFWRCVTAGTPGTWAAYGASNGGSGGGGSAMGGINVKDSPYGALGDMTGPGVGQLFPAIINQAITDAAANPLDKLVIVPPGIYRCTSQILGRPGVRIYLSAGAWIVKDWSANTAPLFGNAIGVNSCDGFVIYGPGKIGLWPGSSYLGRMISMSGNDMLFDGFSIDWFNQTAMGIDGDRIRCHLLKITNPLHDIGCGGIRFSGGDSFVGDDCYVESGDDCLQFVPSGAVSGTNFDRTISNSQFSNCHGVSFAAKFMVFGIQSGANDVGVLDMTCSIVNSGFSDCHGRGNHAARAQNLNSPGVIKDCYITDCSCDCTPAFTAPTPATSHLGINSGINTGGVVGLTVKRFAITHPFCKSVSFGEGGITRDTVLEDLKLERGSGVVEEVMQLAGYNTQVVRGTFDGAAAGAPTRTPPRAFTGASLAATSSLTVNTVPANTPVAMNVINVGIVPTLRRNVSVVDAHVVNIANAVYGINFTGAAWDRFLVRSSTFEQFPGQTTARAIRIASGVTGGRVIDNDFGLLSFTGQRVLDLNVPSPTISRDNVGWTAVTSIAVTTLARDDVGYDVIPLMGQSNMVGYGTFYDAKLDPTDPRIWQFAGSGTYMGQVIVAVDPLAHHQVPPPQGIGHAMTFARLYCETIPVNRRVLLVPCAHGATGFGDGANGTWDHTITSPVSGVNLAQFALAQTLAAIASGPNNRITTILWHQGEGDASNNRSQAAYATLWDELMSWFRANVPGAANIPIVLGQMLPEGIAIDPKKQVVNLAHIDTPDRNVLTGFWYGPTGYAQTGSDDHYNAAGQRRAGLAAFDAWRRAQTNVAGGILVPPLTVTVVQSGTSALMSWTQPFSRATAFTVQYTLDGGTTWTGIAHPSIDVNEIKTGLAVGNTFQARVRTVADLVVSDWTLSNVITLIAPPGQVLGVTAGTATSSTQPLTWSAVAGATSYLVEYKVTTDSTWLPGPTVTGTAATVTGLAASTAYHYRVTASNVGGAGTLSATLTASTASPLTLATEVGVAPVQAFSVARRVVASYAGPLFTVRRSSDSTTSDIGMTGAGNLDEAALVAFCGSGDGFVQQWFDQSGNGWHVTQATTTAQPKIVTAGVVNKRNGKPFMIFDGAGDTFTDTTHTPLYSSTTGASGAMVLMDSGTSTTGTYLVGELGLAAAPIYGLIGLSNVHRLITVLRDDTNFSYVNTAQTGPLMTTTPHAVVATDDLAQIIQYADGVASQAFTEDRSGHTTSITKQTFGALSGATPACEVAERVSWTVALTPAQAQAAQANQKFYYGTP